MPDKVSKRFEPKIEESLDENHEPSHDDIAALAYALWESRGCGEGEAERDWFEAERQLRQLT